MKVFILTSKDLPNLCPDDKNLTKELSRLSIETQICIWNQDIIPDNSMVLIRTIWDYSLHEHEFKNLLNDFKKRNIICINPIETLLWNMDKTYLKELYDLGASCVPTDILKKFSLECLNHSKVQYPLVIKPLVGGGGLDTFKLDSKEHGINLNSLIDKDVIVQPFMESIVELGEISFVYFDGKFSHSLLKRAKKGEFRVQDDHGGSVHNYNPTADEFEQINKILSFVKHDWVYARIDVVKENDRLLVMELELIEPELFFRFSNHGGKALGEALLNCAPS
jgi:glutathione synthase/RimK-type ligase-like ATP-grasp enzyme